MFRSNDVLTGLENPWGGNIYRTDGHPNGRLSGRKQSRRRPDEKPVPAKSTTPRPAPGPGRRRMKLSYFIPARIAHLPWKRSVLLSWGSFWLCSSSIRRQARLSPGPEAIMTRVMVSRSWPIVLVPVQGILGRRWPSGLYRSGIDAYSAWELIGAVGGGSQRWLNLASSAPAIGMMKSHSYWRSPIL